MDGSGPARVAPTSADAAEARASQCDPGAKSALALCVSSATDSEAFMVPLDTQERLELCDLFDELGPSVPTLLEGWTAHDLAAHLVLRERDLVAGPCLVLSGPFRQFAAQRRARLAPRNGFAWLVAWIRPGPPAGFFPIGWIRALANLNEF